MHEHSHSKAINIQRWRVSRTTATESSLWTWNDLWFVYTSLLRIDFSCWTLCGTWFVPHFIAKRRLSAGDITWSIFLFHHYHRACVYTHLSAALISTFRRAFLHRLQFTKTVNEMQWIRSEIAFMCASSPLPTKGIKGSLVTKTFLLESRWNYGTWNHFFAFGETFYAKITLKTAE